MATKRKPKADDLWEHAEALVEEYRGRDQMYDALDDIYDQAAAEAGGEGADQVKRVTMPYGTNAVDLAADLAAQATLAVEVPAAKENKTAQLEADEQEAWFRAFHHLTEQRLRRNLSQDMAWHGAQRSVTCLKTVLLDSAIVESGGTYTANTVPVLMRARDPRLLYWEDGPLGPAVVVETWKRKVADIRRLYPRVLADEDEYPGDTSVAWTEYWDDQYRCYWADGNVVKIAGQDVSTHGYGFLPYHFGMARSTPRHAPEKRYRPLLRGVENLYHNINTWYSILATAGWASVTNAWSVFSDHYGRDGGKSLETTPGAKNYFMKDDRIEPIQRGEMPGDFFQLGTLFLQAWQQGTFPFQLYGELPVAIAGYAINLLTQSGRRPLAPIWDAIEQAYEGAFVGVARLCRDKVAKVIGKEKVSLVVHQPASSPDVRGRLVRRELGLDVGSIGTDFDLYVRLGDPMPQDQAANLRMALEAMSGERPLLSQETALTKYDIVPDALAELDRIAAEMAYRQLAPYEALRIAIDRGYIPENIEIPGGYQVMPDGSIMPEAAAPQLSGAAPAQAPMGQPLTQGQPGLPITPNPQMMQEIAGQTPPISFEELAGAPPPPPVY